jgi:hypothetical protein
MGQTVLCFRLSKEKEQAVGIVCRKLGIRQRKVTGGEYNQKLGYLAGIAGFNKEPGDSVKGALSGEMLVFSGIDSDGVDAFLAAYKQTGAAPIGLKAVLTPHNVFWSVEQLYQELMKEHVMFQKGF